MPLLSAPPTNTSTARAKPEAADGLAWLANLLASIAVLVGAMAVVILVMEGVFALAHVGEEEYLKVDPVLGYAHLENKFITFRSEGFSQDKTNAMGFHDVDHLLAKAPGVTRIALLGDSKTEAFQVPVSSTFGKLLESKLNQHGHFEVLNFGMSAFSTGQEYLSYIVQARAYHPDIAIVFYHYMDAEENVKQNLVTNPVPRPYFSLDKQDRLEIDWSVMKKWINSDRAKIYKSLDWVRRNSRIWGVCSKLEPLMNQNRTFQKIFTCWDRVTGQLGKWILSGIPQTTAPCPALSELDPEPDQAVVDTTKYGALPPVNASSPDAFAIQALIRQFAEGRPVTVAILHRLNNCCLKSHCRLVVAALPAPNNSLSYLKEITAIERLAKEDGFGYININKEFVSPVAGQKSPFFFEKGHLSQRGHRLVSDILQRDLRSMGCTN